LARHLILLPAIPEWRVAKNGGLADAAISEEGLSKARMSVDKLTSAPDGFVAGEVREA